MEKKSNPIQVADRLFGVIELLATRGAMGLMELSKELNLNKTTVHRLLNSLVYMGYVIQDSNTQKYRAGFKICDISNRILSQVDILGVVRPYLRELANITNETVHLVQLDGVNAVYIDKIETTVNSIRLVSQLGRQVPLYSSGVGKAILAELNEEEIKDIWDKSEIVKYTPNTIVEYKVLQKALEEIRTKGYAIDDEENEMGVCCIAATIVTKETGGRYAFSISMPIYRMDSKRMEELTNQVLKIKSIMRDVI